MIAIARLKVPALAAFTTVPTEPDIVNVGAARVLTKPQMLGLNARVLYAFQCLGLVRKEKDSTSVIRVQVPSPDPSP